MTEQIAVFPLYSTPDAPKMAGLHAEAMPDEPWDAAALTAILDGGARGLGTRDGDGALLGFVLVRTAADEAEILTICVGEAARRRGVGAALLRAACAAAAKDGAETMFLEVAADNDAAQALYAAAGFAEVGRRRGYYRRGESKVDAIVMSASLKRQT